MNMKPVIGFRNQPSSVEQFQLEITAPNDPHTVIATFTSPAPNVRISKGDHVEHLVENQSFLTANTALIASRIHHSLSFHSGKRFITTRIETRTERIFLP